MTGSLDADPTYAALLKGKRVVVVGPSATILKSRQGRDIDAYDIVVRFNDAIDHLPLTGPSADDLGTRADIIYANQRVLNQHIASRGDFAPGRLAGIYAEAGVKYVVCTNNSLSYNRTGEPLPHCPGADKRVTRDFARFLRSHGATARLRVVYAASEMLVRWLSGNYGRTGFVAIADLLSFEISHLFVTGMTFYYGGGHLYPQSTHELHPLKHRDGTWAQDRFGLGHNSYLELEAMRVLARCFRSRLAFDGPLQALLDK